MASSRMAVQWIKAKAEKCLEKMRFSSLIILVTHHTIAFSQQTVIPFECFDLHGEHAVDLDCPVQPSAQ